MGYEMMRFPYDGTIDADGHVLEPAWLWEEYLEERYRARALRIRTDDDGLEYLELDGRPSERTTKGVARADGRDGRSRRRSPAPDRRYMDHIPFGAGDASERVELLDQENLEKSVLYPTIGLLWECEVDGPRAHARLHARLQPLDRRLLPRSGGRLVPIAHLSLLDPEASARELERAVADGCRGGFVAPFTHTRKPHGHPDHDALFAQGRASSTCRSRSIRPTSPAGRSPVRFKRPGPRDASSSTT